MAALKMQVCRLREGGLEGENVVASDYIILLPLSAVKPDPIADSQEGTVQSNAEAEVGGRFIIRQS